jgi:hypothetical protein
MAVDSLPAGELDTQLRQAAAELRQHLETDKDCRVETILNAFPSLASDSHCALELIVLEYQLRREMGQNPEPLQWYERFPQWRDRLRDRLEELAPIVVATAELETVVLQSVRHGGEGKAVAAAAGDEVPLLGRHEILEEIGRGGMGVVYRARDLVLERIVALKVIRSGSLASDEEVSFFYREARAAARLRHPNIVPIYGMGLHEQQHCFSMALFPQGSLSEHLNDFSRDIRAAVRLTAKTARAVQAAHEHGIIHRDLKPGNILLDENGEPVVSDFGLAKRQDSSVTVTLSGRVIGTPAYMAPEQARGETVTRAADLWALGVILYELLTGSRPFRGDNADEVKQKVVHADPLPPRRLRAELPADLETIVLKCLSKEPERRYGSAAELADDLERWLDGEPIQARPEPRWQHWRRQFRRRVGTKGMLLLLVGLLLMVAGAAGVWTLFIYLAPAAREQRRQAEVLASLLRERAEDKSVTLIGPTGPPRWYRWRTEKDRPPLPELRQWPLQLASYQAPLLLELLPDPQQDSYRFSAEIQAAGQDKMRIGLYFGHEELATPAGLEQCFGLFQLLIENGQAQRAQLRLAGVYEQDVDEVQKQTELVPSFKPPLDLLSKVPPPPIVNGDGQPWRRIEVEVTPVAVRASCDDCPMGAYAVSDEKKCIARMWRSTHPRDFPLPSFPPRGGLGLYLLDGPAFFRNVVVQPLPQP